MEAARRAISSPLLEGASVNGARGVIINVTGGPDLSLVEVSDASTIVQEAADEDANIIFGAVVDPALKGKVKITVIATGFGPHVGARGRPARAAQTPVDMTPYADAAAAARRRRQRRAAGVGERSAAVDRPPRRCSICRWPQSAAARRRRRRAGGSAASTGDAIRTMSSCGSTFDVPAFLRRQEGLAAVGPERRASAVAVVE